MIKYVIHTLQFQMKGNHGVNGQHYGNQETLTKWLYYVKLAGDIIIIS